MVKLGNERFVQNAPPAVIEMERKKQSDAESRIKSLEERIRELKRL
jgi:valyl-tRNA synthetase